MASASSFDLTPQSFANNTSLQLHQLLIGDKPHRVKRALKRGGKKFVNIQDPDYGLTPLGVAVIQGDLTNVTLLLKAKADPRIGDKKKWTPLHLAYVRGKEEIIQALLEADKTHQYGLQKLKNSNGATPLDLKQKQQFHLPSLSKLVFSYQDEEGNIVPGTAEQFKELTGAYYTDEIVTTPRKQAATWRYENPPLPPLFAEEYYIQAYQNYQTNPPALYVAENQAGLGLYAGQTIKSGQIIWHFSGMRSTQQRTPNDKGLYEISDLNAYAFRNLASLANDSFPNACAEELTVTEAGNTRIGVLIAHDTIEKGEQIVWNYGHHVVKSQLHLELNLQKMKKFFRKNSLSFLTKEYLSIYNNRLDGKVNDLMNAVKINSVLEYLFQTPSSVIHLLFDEIIDCASLEQFVDIIQKFSWIKTSLLSILGFIIETYAITEKVENTYPTLGKELRQSILNIAGNYPYYIAFKFVFFYIMRQHDLKNINPSNKETILNSIHTIGGIAHQFHLCVDSSNFDDFFKYLLEQFAFLREFVWVIAHVLRGYVEEKHSSHLNAFNQSSLTYGFLKDLSSS